MLSVNNKIFPEPIFLILNGTLFFKISRFGWDMYPFNKGCEEYLIGLSNRSFSGFKNIIEFLKTGNVELFIPKLMG